MIHHTLQSLLIHVGALHRAPVIRQQIHVAVIQAIQGACANI